MKTRKCYIQHWASKGEFYIGGFVLLTFIELVRLAFKELRELVRLVFKELVSYKTTYVELAFAQPNAVAFSSFDSFKTIILCISISLYRTHEKEHNRSNNETEVDGEIGGGGARGGGGGGGGGRGGGGGSEERRASVEDGREEEGEGEREAIALSPASSADANRTHPQTSKVPIVIQCI